MDKIDWSRVREIEVVLLEARNGMNSFQPAQMTCGAELIRWNLAKARAAALCDEIVKLKGNVFNRRERLQDAAFILKFQTDDCESIARWGRRRLQGCPPPHRLAAMHRPALPSNFTPRKTGYRATSALEGPRGRSVRS